MDERHSSMISRPVLFWVLFSTVCLGIEAVAGTLRLLFCRTPRITPNITPRYSTLKLSGSQTMPLRRTFSS